MNNTESQPNRPGRIGHKYWCDHCSLGFISDVPICPECDGIEKVGIDEPTIKVPKKYA